MPQESLAYVTFGRSGLRVSPFLLGGGAFGYNTPPDVSDAITDRYIANGGNFIDTAEIYGMGKSEEWLGAYLASRGGRERLVIGTKYSPNMDRENINAGGNGRKNMLRAIDGSLSRLGTDYVDMYWLHSWDRVTPPEEVVRTMDDLIRAGKIRYYGFSNVPAWYVARAATIAEQRGLERPIGLQLSYSLVERNIEREHIPAAQETGLAVCIYTVLADGFLTGKYRKVGDSWEGSGKLDNQRRNNFAFIRTVHERDWDILAALMEVADGLGRPPAEVALCWAAGRPGITAPLLGASRPEQITAQIEALSIPLPADARAALDQASALPGLFPYTMFTPEFQALMEASADITRWRPAF